MIGGFEAPWELPEHTISKMTPMDARKLQLIGSRALLSGDKNKFNRALALEKGHLKRISDARFQSGTPIRKSHNRERDAAIGGAGAVAAGSGLAAGGIPGAKPNAGALSSKGVRRAAAAPGGVLGYRVEAHHEANRKFNADKSKHAKTKGLTRVQHFLRGRTTGKIGPEHEIIRDLKVARKGATLALVGGSAAVGYGALNGKRHSSLKKSSQADKERTTAGALIGGGAGMAAVGAGGSKMLDHQALRWKKKSDASVARAGKVVPGLNRMSRPVRDSTSLSPSTFGGTSNARAAEAGVLHGRAAQERYFADAFHTNAKMIHHLKKPGLAALGAGGVISYGEHRARKQKLKKADENPSIKRTATTAAFPGTHGVIAGKPGKKIRASANESVPAWVFGAGGTALGSLPGAKMRNVKVGAIGAIGGGIAGRTTGALVGMHRNHRKQHYKDE